MNKLGIVTALLTLAVGLAVGWQAGSRGLRPDGLANPHGHDDGETRKVLYWYDPMKPEAHFPQPGKSPFMDMDLVPRYADEDSNAMDGNAAPGLGLRPEFRQNLGVKLARVEKGVLARAIEVSGSVVFDEHAVALLQARTGGIVERAWPLAVGDRVRAGQPLADIRVPEWFAAQGEYLALRDMPALGAAARSRLLQLGMTPAQIVAVERRGQPHAVMTFHAPRAGMLAEFDLHQGMTLGPGQTVARINGLDSVWIEAQTPEIDAARLTTGGKLTLRLLAFPGETFTGRIDALIPELNRETRTVRVRIHLPNPAGRLRPGMFAQVRLEEEANEARLLVPSDAIIATGKRHVIIVATDDGRFMPVEVSPGMEANNRSEILAGLEEGEHVVVSGQFMIDSEASLRGVLARMETDTKFPNETHTGVGIVKSVTETEIVLTHEPIPELAWPAMTMPFTLAQAGLAANLVPGQKVRFHFRETDEGAIIQRLEVLPPAAMKGSGVQ
ncbi:MAG: efflux RND transporter periplasmic adaptor subunit [Azoarcus sp.]|jgi:Cu(I)/Ag(I) efflux system membrane fusion protein|nr:efflux RND transporter periplasmic adaptor subunit [Azoarcus sp.]